jgi:hypothetical protein
MIAAARMAHVDHGNGARPMDRQMEAEDPLRRAQAPRLRRAAQTAGPAIRCNSQLRRFAEIVSIMSGAVSAFLCLSAAARRR